MIDWLNNNWIETAGAVLTLLFLYLEVTRKWTMWIVGIFSGLFYVYINFHQQLYAMMGLRSYDVFVSFYGLYCWRFAKMKDNSQLPFCFIDKKLTFFLSVIGIAIYAVLFFIIVRFTNIANPLEAGEELIPFCIELLTATLSIIAVWMAAKKIVESWYLWMIVNPCSIILYIYKGMYPSTILYVIYAIFSIVGYIQWRKTAIQQK